MIKSDIDTAVDDERRKTGTGFIAAAEKTRYENLALNDISANADLYEQEATASFSYVPGSAEYTVNKLSAVVPNLKTRDAIIGFNATSSTTQIFNRINPENMYMYDSGDVWSISGDELWLKHDGNSGDTINVRYVTNYVARTSAGTLSASMTASTDEPLSDIDPEAIIQYVLWKIFKKEGKKDDAAESKKYYQEMLKGLQQDSKYRRSNVYDRMGIETQIDSDWTRRI